jgi:Kdo2-lipid IVA lauroyltransferase/acyltransferase
MGRILMRLAAALPLPLLHAAGWALGWAMYGLSSRYRAHLKENLALGGYGEDKRVRREAITAAGCLLTELPALWMRPQKEVAGWVREIEGLELVEQAKAEGRGIVFLTPHHGCFEITAQYGGLLFPMTVMYRPPKLAWLEPIMRAGRERPGVRLATADLNGVRDLLFALKRHEAIGILPDQVPGEGEGEWAEFFGRPAYTMTLAPRLVTRPNVVCLMAFARRLPRGRGYALSVRRLADRLPGETEVRRLNRCLEDLIRSCPGQYLWGYNRYKIPAGAEGPP